VVNRLQLKKRLLLIFGSGLIGLLSVVLPPFILGIKKAYPTLFLTAIENVSIYSICISAVLLILWGCYFGLVNPEHWGQLTIVSIGLYPIMIIIDLIIDPTSHNLWPFELIQYVFVIVPVYIGALVGTEIAKRRSYQGQEH
jgi:hypothetical protein